jgi:hypothetical protein
VRRSILIALVGLSFSLPRAVADPESPAYLPATTPNPTVLAAPQPEGWPGMPTPCPTSGGSTMLAPAAPAADPLPAFWKNVPPVYPIARPGDFTVPPTGPGYYSLLDCLTGTERQAPPKYPYPAFALIQPPLFNFSFAYLDDPNLPDSERDYLDFLKRIHLGNDFLLSTGGQSWIRYMNEFNSRLSGKNNDYELWRLRANVDFWYRDCFRVYVEFLSAQTFNQDLAPLTTDRDYADLLNAFVEVKLAEIAGHNAYARIGRQELCLGSQRLVSALDWANTRRTFQGASIYYTGDQWDFFTFWAQPVIPNPTRFDSVDDKQNFAGAWLTYRPQKGTAIDLYYLMLDNANHTTQVGLVTAPYTVHTIGSRATGNLGQFLYDAEGMLQLGEQGSNSICAGAASGGLGWDFQKLPMKPVLWGCYDYASGDHSPNSGTYTTFNQLFPFGHYYLGWIDLVGRQNITDANAHLFLYPTNWITFWGQFHHFELVSSKDALYNTAGVAYRRDPTGAAGRNVGNEMDFILNFHLDNHNDFMVGYLYMFAGKFVEKTAPTPAAAADPRTFYFLYSFRW